MAILSWGVAILKSDFSVSLCQFSKKRPKKKLTKSLTIYTILILLDDLQSIKFINELKGV